jgi:Putative Ig domain
VQFFFVRRLSFFLTLLLALSTAAFVNSCGNSVSNANPDLSSQIKISTSSLPNGQSGTAYSTTLTATGGVSPYTWSLTGRSLPAGLTLNASTGAITGTPSACHCSAMTGLKVDSRF